MMTTTEERLVRALDLDQRRTLVRAAIAGPRGIDFVEVLSNFPGSPERNPGVPQQRTLLVYLLDGDDAAALAGVPVQVLGGVRADDAVNPIRVEWTAPADTLIAGGTPAATAADQQFVASVVEPPDRPRVLVVRTSSSGDWSTYTIVIGDLDGAAVAGVDSPLAAAPFRFKVDCPSDLDCDDDDPCPPVPPVSPALDYLARDYEALRARLLDRISTVLPDWTDRNPADIGVTFAELFAYLGDHLALWQDAVASEAYLTTARSRVSVRRHARLLDYRLNEGCAARTFLAFRVGLPTTIPTGTPVSDRHPEDSTGSLQVVDALRAGGVVFETRHGIRATPARNAVLMHGWGQPDFCLPAGATSAYLRFARTADPHLEAGDVVVLAPLDDVPPSPGGAGDLFVRAAQGDPRRRKAVRLVATPLPITDKVSAGPDEKVVEIRWSIDDALDVPLPVNRPGAGGAEPAAVALANLAVADHGGTLVVDHLVMPAASLELPLRVEHPIAWAAPLPDAVASAAAVLAPDARAAAAQIRLHDGTRPWEWHSDLLAESRLATAFVVETEADGTAIARFGDGVHGRRPASDTSFTAVQRAGGGRAGNVGANALGVFLTATLTGDRFGDDVLVTNPVRAVGGVDAEPAKEVKLLAPHAFRRQRRAVIPGDYADVAMEDPAVQRATARRRWTGSWWAQAVTIDAIAGVTDSDEVGARVLAALETRRMCGVDVELEPPVVVPVEIVVDICVRVDFVGAHVIRDVMRVMSSARRPDGTRGFFHPDNFTFGQPLYVSDLVAAIAAVPGVSWVTVGDEPGRNGLRFRRYGCAPRLEVERGRIDVGPREVVQCENDPSNPERGLFAVRIGARR